MTNINNLDIIPEPEDLKIEFDIYQKTKYEIWINSDCIYFFVTTRYSEQECIEFLKTKIKENKYYTHKYYYVFKTVNGIRDMIHREYNPAYIYKKQTA